jgi:hypothetical protein
MMMTLRRLVVGLTAAVWLVTVGSLPATAQIRERFETDPPSGVLADAAFEMLLRRYMSADGEFKPYYAWDAHLALDLTIYRRGAHAAGFSTTMQAVGTENFGSRVSVGGTGYLIGFDYRRTVTPDTRVTVGIMHLSSHLTRDLDEKIAEERGQGRGVPDVIDSGMFNVPYVRLAHSRATWRLTPSIDVIVHPVSIRLRGGYRTDVRPVHLRSHFTLWSSARLTLASESLHELGRHSFHHVSAVVEARGAGRGSPRVQAFVGFTPGRQLHVSPDVGAVRGGTTIGVRLNAGR